MTDSVQKTIEREAAISARLTPGNKKVEIYKVANSSLYRLKLVNGCMPESMRTASWTTAQRADEEAVRWLKKLWDESDAQAERNKKQAGRARQAAKVAREEAKSAADS